MCAAESATGVDGVIRDPHGTPQMGVLVELLRGSVIATAFTDLQGRYHIAQVTPGIYDLRTSATLFLPTLHRSLLLRQGVPATFNLTLTGLFDQTGWLPLPHRIGKGDVEDWKWTLRSPANRPMLRVLDKDADAQEGTAPEVPAPATQHAHAILTSTAGGGGFGTVGSRIGLETRRQTADHRSSDALLFSQEVGRDVATPAVEMVAARETGTGTGIQRRVLVGFRSVPQIRTQSGEGLTVFEIDSAERMELGSMAAVEVGGQTQALRSGATLLVMHPFAQVSAHARGVWLVRYQYATSPDTSSFASLDEHQVLTRVPTVVDGSAGARTEAGSHQECAVARAIGAARLEVAGFHDAEPRVFLTGQIGRQTLHAPPHSLAGVAVDESNGSFQKLIPGFAGDGMRVSLAAPLGASGQITAAYINSIGMGERLAAASATTITPQRASAVYVAVTREIAASGTQLAVSYRWQPARMLTTVGRYELSDVSPYLGLHLVQALPGGRASGWHTEIVIDASNSLAEGYRSASDTAQDAQFMSALREIRAGLAVSF